MIQSHEIHSINC